MRLPRDLSGRDLARALEVLGYRITRQTGSHLRLTTQQSGEHHVTIPDHKALRVGTLVPPGLPEDEPRAPATGPAQPGEAQGPQAQGEAA